MIAWAKLETEATYCDSIKKCEKKIKCQDYDTRGCCTIFKVHNISKYVNILMMKKLLIKLQTIAYYIVSNWNYTLDILREICLKTSGTNQEGFLRNLRCLVRFWEVGWPENSAIPRIISTNKRQFFSPDSSWTKVFSVWNFKILKEIYFSILKFPYLKRLILYIGVEILYLVERTYLHWNIDIRRSLKYYLITIIVEVANLSHNQ